MAHKKTLKTINIEREKVLMKGYANIADIKKFIPCSDKRANEINEEITCMVEKSGKRVFLGIRSKYLLDYVGLTAKQVFDFAEIKKKKAAISSSS